MGKELYSYQSVFYKQHSFEYILHLFIRGDKSHSKKLFKTRMYTHIVLNTVLDRLNFFNPH